MCKLRQRLEHVFLFYNESSLPTSCHLVDAMTNILPEFARNLHAAEIGTGRVLAHANSLELAIEPATSGYSDAQLTDYDPAVRHFTLKPPVTMTLTAYAAEPLAVGTAGFGFWNHPFQPGQRGIRLPQALWFFFGARPNNMALALDVPGSGFKAGTFNAQRWQFLAMLPLALPGFLLMRVPALYRALWPIGQRTLGVSEATLDAHLLRERHTYTLDWQINRAIFSVDDAIVMQTERIPNKPLGFIAWVDNQYAIVTPQGQFSFGISPIQRRQSLIIEQIELQKSH